MQNVIYAPFGMLAPGPPAVAIMPRHARKRTVRCPDLHCVVQDVGDVVLLHGLSPFLEPLDQVGDRPS